MGTPVIDCDRSDPRPNWSVLLESGEGDDRTLVQWVGNAETEAGAVEVAARVARMARAIAKAATGRDQRPVDAVMGCCDGEDVPPSLTISRPANAPGGGLVPDLGRLAVEAAAAALVCALKGARGQGQYEVTVGVGKRWHHKAPYAVEIRGDSLTGHTYPQMSEPLRDALMALAIAGVIAGAPEGDAPLAVPSRDDAAANRATVTSLLRRLGLEAEADAFESAYAA